MLVAHLIEVGLSKVHVADVTSAYSNAKVMTAGAPGTDNPVCLRDEIVFEIMWLYGFINLTAGTDIVVPGSIFIHMLSPFTLSVPEKCDFPRFLFKLFQKKATFFEKVT